MKLFNWINRSIKQFHWYHISLIKLSTAAAVLLIAKYWPPLLAQEWYIYVAVAVVAAIPPFRVMLRSK